MRSFAGSAYAKPRQANGQGRDAAERVLHLLHLLHCVIRVQNSARGPQWSPSAITSATGLWARTHQTTETIIRTMARLSIPVGQRPSKMNP